MEDAHKSLTDNQLITLRESIKTKYSHYHLKDPVQFPIFAYNTNRANYEPLRASFEEEFYVVRNLDRLSPTIHIPSTNTLAMLFTDDSYIPNKKILNTCRSYAEGKTANPSQPEPSSPNLLPLAPAKPNRRLWMGDMASVLLLAGLLIAILWLHKPRPSDLVIECPISQSTVVQMQVIQGWVKNAETVWVIVRSTAGPQCYVQPAVRVQYNGWWIGVIYIGSALKIDDGHRYQFRAFVNPTKALYSGMILADWPEAELASDIVEVVRQ